MLAKYSNAISSHLDGSLFDPNPSELFIRMGVLNHLPQSGYVLFFYVNSFQRRFCIYKMYWILGIVSNAFEIPRTLAIVLSSLLPQFEFLHVLITTNKTEESR